MLSYEVAKLIARNVLFVTCGVTLCLNQRPTDEEYNSEFQPLPLLHSQIVILNTIDGSIIGINASDGVVLWHIDGQPLISQSLSDLHLYLNGIHYTVIPSLDGHLYLLKRDPYSSTSDASLKALPLTIDGLLSSNFMLTQDSVLTGGRDISVFSFEPLTGQVKYNCSRDGCFGAASQPNQQNPDERPQDECTSILAYQSNHVIRAVHLPSGLEHWNLSIRQYDLCVIRNQPVPFSKSTAMLTRPPMCDTLTTKLDGSGVPPSKGAAGGIATNFDLFFDGSLLKATSSAPLNKELWTYKPKSRLIKAWVFSTDTKDVRPLSLFTNGSPRASANLPQSHTSDQPVSKSKVFTKFFDGLRYINSLHKPSPLQTSEQRCSSLNRIVYLGSLDGQLYVHVEDDRGAIPNSINLAEDCNADNISSSFSNDAGNTDDSKAGEQVSLTGYYRATYTSSDHPVCKQPFLTSSLDVGEKGLIPWSPFADNSWEDMGCQRGKDQVDGFQSSLIGKQHMTDWVVDGAHHLIMLLLRANDELLNSDVPLAYPKQPLPDDNFSVLGHLFHLLMMVTILFCVYRYLLPIRPRSQLSDDSETRTPPTILCLPESVQVRKQSTEKDVPALPLVDNPCSSSLNGYSTLIAFYSTFDNEFQFIRRLGRGGFGQVFEVENRFDGCRYAIKRIPVTERGEEERKFLREVKALASLDHPGIVRYHRAWSECPPLGWQESRDLALIGETSARTDDGSSTTNLLVSKTQDWSTTPNNRYTGPGDSPDFGEQEDCIEKTTSGNIFSKTPCDYNQGKLDDDDDSLIVFQRQPNGGSCMSTQTTTDSSSLSPAKTTTTDPLVVTYLYIQMQLCSPTSLRDWLLVNNTEESRPGRSGICDMFRQIVDAVAYLHDQGLMHRDLKPSNILFDLANPSRLKLADFGLVTSMLDEESRLDLSGALAPCATMGNNSSMNTVPNTTDSPRAGPPNDMIQDSPMREYICLKSTRRHTDYVGTGLYMSPEQDRGERYDHKVDIFSLGLIYLELRVVFNTNMERIMCLTQAKLQILPVFLAHNNPEEAAFLSRMLDVSPSTRPTATQLLADPLLQSQLSGAG